MNGNGYSHNPESGDDETIPSLSKISWEMPLPLTLPWGTIRVKGTASIQVRSRERLEALGIYGAQIAAIQDVITQSLEDVMIALLPEGYHLLAQIGQIASATLVSVNSKIYDYGVVLLDLAILELVIYP